MFPTYQQCDHSSVRRQRMLAALVTLFRSKLLNVTPAQHRMCFGDLGRQLSVSTLPHPLRLNLSFPLPKHKIDDPLLLLRKSECHRGGKLAQHAH